MIKISHYVKNSKYLGPGERFCIWFQGCQKRCVGCINPDGQDLDNGQVMAIEDILNIIKSQNSITGVTISGGEPFLQDDKLEKFIKLIKKETDLDIMVYTGYSLDELKKKNPYYEKDLFPLIDILVDGEYKKELNNNEMFRGSSNQNIYFFTEKYKKFESIILNKKNRSIEFQINNNDEVFMVGIPPKDFYDEFIENIKKEI